LIDAKYEMYWISGAFSGVRRNPPPPSSVIPSFVSAFPPVPTAPPEVCRLLAGEVGQIICLATPEPFFGVGAWYEDFSQVSDQEVRRILDKAMALAAHTTPGQSGAEK